jgi:hypothetical protein
VVTGPGPRIPPFLIAIALSYPLRAAEHHSKPVAYSFILPLILDGVCRLAELSKGLKGFRMIILLAERYSPDLPSELHSQGLDGAIGPPVCGQQGLVWIQPNRNASEHV